MKILLLGGAGFIGSSLSAQLIKAGYEVAVVSHGYPTPRVPTIQYFADGLDNASLLTALLPECSHVFHVASATTPGSSRLQPSAEMVSNLVPLARLLETMRHFPRAHLIFVSSGGAIYGNYLGGPADENAPVSPISDYGAGKAASEAFLRAYHAQTGNGVTVLRPSNLYGPGQRSKASFAIVPTLFACARERRPLELWGDGEIVRDYLYIEDFVDLCVRTIPWTENRRDYSVFNVGSGKGYSINQLCDEIGAITGTKLEVLRRPPRGVDVSRIVLNSTSAQRTFDWKVRTELAEGLQRTWNWFIEAQRTD